MKRLSKKVIDELLSLRKKSVKLQEYGSDVGNYFMKDAIAINKYKTKLLEYEYSLLKLAKRYFDKKD